jgi:hypothetical protein
MTTGWAAAGSTAPNSTRPKSPDVTAKRFQQARFVSSVIGGLLLCSRICLVAESGDCFFHLSHNMQKPDPIMQSSPILQVFSCDDINGARFEVLSWRIRESIFVTSEVNLCHF